MAKEELDFSGPIEEPEVPIKAPVKKGRGTDLIETAKQFGAGATDVATGIPSLAAIIPSAVGAGYEAATTDKDFVESFFEHQQLPFMQGAMNITHAGRGVINDLLGIKEPVRTEDQVARLISSTFIPGVGVLGALANAPSKVAAAGRMLTPVMKVTKSPTGSYLTGGNILRGGAQIGMGGAIDQTMRHLKPHPEFPTLWSEEALTGGTSSTATGGGQATDTLDFSDPISDPNTLDFSDSTALDAPVSDAQNKGPGTVLEQKLRAMNEEDKRNENADTAMNVALIFGAAIGSYAAKRAITNRMQTAADRAGPLGSADPDLRGIDKTLVEIHEQSGAWNKAKKAGSIAKNYLHKDWADSSQHVLAQLKSKGVPEDVIQKLAHVASSDWRSIATQFRWTGELGQGSGIKTHAPRELELEYAALNSKDPVLQIGPDNWLTQRELFDLSELARTEQTNRSMATAFDVLERTPNADRQIPGLAEALAKSDLREVRRILDDNYRDVDHIRRTLTDLELEQNPHMANKMWGKPREIQTGLKKKAGKTVWDKGDRYSNDMLAKIVEKADADTAIDQLSRKASDVMDALLDYRVHLKDITPEQAQTLRNRFTVGDADSARMAYVHMVTAQGQVGFWEKLANVAGFRTRKAQENNYQKELLQRGIEQGTTTDKPIHSLQALNRYADSTIEGVNSNNFMHHALTHITEMRHTPGKGRVDELHDLQYATRDADGKIINLKEADQPLGQAKARADDANTPQYLGYKPFDATKDSLGEWKGFVVPGTKTPRALPDIADDIVWTQQYGRSHAWKVPDAGLRAALELNPNLSPGQHFLKHWNNIFKAGTTGPLSAFAPVAHIFSAQQIATNLVGRSSKKHLSAIGEGGVSFVQGLKGTWDLLKVGWAKERADYLAQRISSQMARGEMPSAHKLQLRDRLESVYKDSFMLKAQKESGRTSGYMGGNTRGFMDSFNENEANFVRHVGLDQANLVWRMWKAWNHAWHEGPAFAQMAKHYGANMRRGMSAKDEARLLRESGDFAKTMAGDMRKVGGSTAAKWFDSAVPFAPAMIQSWASIGGAIKANPYKFLSGVSALVMAPTAAEVMWNFTMSSDKDVYFDENNRGWTHNEYYWKAFNSQQRASTNIVMIPGVAPWKAHQFPVSPEWGLVRGFVIDTMDALFNFSGTRGVEDLQPEQWNAVAGLNRVLDIAMPPLAAALFTKVTGQSVRGGVSFDAETEKLSVTSAIPIGTGSRYSAQDMSQAKGSMDRTSAEMLQDIFGSGGKLLVDVWNAATAGLDDRYDGTVTNAFTRGTEAAGLAINQQLKFGAMVFGRPSKLSTMQPAGKRMYKIKETMKALQDMERTLKTGGIGDMRRIFRGNGLNNMMNDSAVWNDIALSVGGLNAQLQETNENISSLRKENNSLGKAGNISVSQSRRILDANNAELNDMYNEQYALTKQWEKRMSKDLQTRYNDPDIEVDLEGDIPQSRLEGKSYLERLRTP